jgi:uncharacterized integral membrane protein
LPGERRTRLSGVWTAVVVGLVALVVILVFILQNQQSVEVSFPMFSGHLPLAVALLFAMILGALTVFAFGAALLDWAFQSFVGVAPAQFEASDPKPLMLLS